TIAYATSLVQKLGGWISQLGPTGQKFLGGLLLFAGVFFSAAKHFYAGYWQGVGFNAAVNKGGFLSGVKDFFGKFNPRNIFKSRTTIPSGVLPGSMNVPPPGAANNVAGMGQALKSFPDAKQLLSLSVALVGLGVAFVGIGFGIKLAADGLSGLVGAFNNISNAGVALGAVAVVMGGFVGMLAVMIPVIGALGATSVAVWPGLLALGFVFAGIGLGINLASKGIAILVQSFEGMVVSISKVAKSAPQLMYMAGALSFLAPALFAFGAAALFAMPGMIALAAGFALLTPSLSITIPFLKLLSELKLDSLKGIGSSLLSLTPGLLAFSSIGLIAPLLLMAGAATNLLFKGISSLSSNVDTKFLKNVTDDLSSLVGGLIKFSTIGVFSDLISLASGSLFILGNALNQFNNSKNVDFKNISDTLNSLYSPLIKFSTLGLFAAPMILASTGLRILSSTLKPISEGFNSLNNVNFTKFSGLSSGILSLIPGLLSIASIGIMSVPILLGATVMNTIGSSISNMITGFNSLDKVNLSGLNSMTKEIPNITKSLLGLSVLGIIAIPFSIASSLLAGAGKMLGSSSTGFKEFLSVNWEGFGSATRSMSDFIGSLVKFSFLSIVAAPVLLGATLLGSAGSLLAMAAKGFNLFGSVNTSNISDVVNSMTGLASSLTKLVTLNFIAPAILSGASVLGLAGIAFSTAFNGFDKISKVNWSGLNKMSTVLSDIAQPLLGFSAIGLISPLLTTAGIAISSLGNGIVSLAKANFSNLSGVSDIFSKLSPALIKFSAIGLISVPVMAGASALGSIGKSLGLASDGFKSMSGVEWSSIGRMGNVLNDVVPILSNFGFKSIASAPGLWLMNSTLSTLASTMHKLSDPINISSEALGEMADNLQKLQTVAKTIDLSKLRDIGDASDKMINAKINYSSSKQEVSESKSETIKVDPIQVEVVMKYPDGKEMHRLIVEANAYRT
nr:hypothetical protein [Candidatus Dojkabacteria bacterium]